MVSDMSQRFEKSNHTKVSKASKTKSLRDRSSEERSKTDGDATQRTPNKHFKQQPQKMSLSQSANGQVSDSETDIDKPLRLSVASKSVDRSQSVRNTHRSQNVPERESESESEDEPQSISLLQLPASRISPQKRSSEFAAYSSRPIHESTPAGNFHKIVRKPNIPTMSSSEYESNSEEEAAFNSLLQSKSGSKNESEIIPHPSLQQESESNAEEESEFEEQEEVSHPVSSQPQRESESEEESEFEQESKFEPTLNHSVRVKEEVPTPESSFVENEAHADGTGRVSHHSEEFQNPLNLPEGGHGSLNTALQNPPFDSASQQAAAISLFEREHSPVSAPVVDIPSDSHVWMLQVPRSIPADQLQGQRLPVKLQGGEILDLHSGHWQILEQPCMVSENALSCIVSTGNLSYTIRRLQPNTYWFLKRVPTSINVESQELWRKEANPIPIKDLLKMKTKRIPSSHKVKRVREASPVQPEKYIKSEDDEDSDLGHPSSSKRKKKKHEKSFEEESSVKDADLSHPSPSKRKKKKHEKSFEEESSVKEPHTGKATNKHHHKVHNDHHSTIDFSKLNMSSSFQVQEPHSGTNKHRHKVHKDHHSAIDSSKMNMSSPSFQVHGGDPVKEKKRKRTVEDGEVTPKSEKKIKLENDPSDTENTFSEAKMLVTDANVTNEDYTKHKDKKKKMKEKKNKHGKSKSNKYETSMIKGEIEELVKKKRKEYSKENSSVISEEHKTKIKYAHPKEEKEEEDTNMSVIKKKKKKHKHKDNKDSKKAKVRQEKDFWERETTPDYLSSLYLTQIAPDDI